MPLYDIAFDPVVFAFYVLLQRKLSITEIAQIIGHSHPSVSQIVKEMTNIGPTTAKSVSDARVNVVKLSDRGQHPYNQKSVHRRNPSCGRTWGNANDLEGDWGNGVLLERKDFYTRVREKRKARESQQVEIIDYSLSLRRLQAFELRVDWEILQIESTDHQSLNHPSEKILQPWAYFNGTLQPWNRRYLCFN